MVLTCKRWRRVFYSEPALWRTFTLKFSKLHRRPEEEWPVWLQKQAALVRRVAPVLQGLHWDAAAQEEIGINSAASFEENSVPAFLGYLQTSRLKQLKLQGLDRIPEAAAMSLGRFTQLTELSLCSTRPLPPQMPRSLAQLGELRSLRFSGPAVPPALLNSILALSQLTMLDLWADIFPPPAAMDQLTRLAQLQDLGLHAGFKPEAEVFQPPAPARFPAGLQGFFLARIVGSFQASSKWQQVPTLCGGRMQVPDIVVCFRLVAADG